MYTYRNYVRRLAIWFAACLVLMFGAGVTPASAASDDHGKATGVLEVCKKVQGGHGDQKFDFVVKKDKKEVKLTLKANECRKEKVETGRYSVTEYVPKNCELVKIRIDGKGKSSVKDATAWVEVEKDKTTTVTFFNKCKKDS
jgi:hypothetical protein